MENPSRSMYFVHVEGNIGSGKSTLLQALQKIAPRIEETYHARVFFMQEDIAYWQSFGENVNVFELYYKNQKTFAYVFQMIVLLSKLSQLERLLSDCADEERVIVFWERSLYSDADIFATMLRDDGVLALRDFASYTEFRHVVMERMNACARASLIVYIAVDPHLCHERITQRARKEESKMTLQYLTNVHTRHEVYFSPKNSRIPPVYHIMHDHLERMSCDEDQLLQLCSVIMQKVQAPLPQ